MNQGRLVFAMITVFWLAMNVLLWRQEWGGAGEMGSRVPLRMVWQKLLTAPDHSSLEILQQGKSIGYFRWTPEVREGRPARGGGLGDLEPEGRISGPALYVADGEGSILLTQLTNRLKFSVHLIFATNLNWDSIGMRAELRPQRWEIEASAREEILRLNLQSPGLDWKQELTFAQLRDPRQWLAPSGVSWLLGAWDPAGLSQAWSNRLALGLECEACQDWLKIGQAQVRGYQLTVRWLDRYQARVLISRVGEILRVELPEEILLVNELVSAR